MNNINQLNIIIVENADLVLSDFFNNIDHKYHYLYYKSLNNIKYNIFQNEECYQFLINCIDCANNIINEQDANLLLHSNIWKIFIYNNIMWNYPFTLQDIIFIPIDYIVNCSESNSYSRFIKTIIHERIHVSQRLNIDLWNNFITHNNNWIKITDSNKIFNFIKYFDFYSFLNHSYIPIINPDSFYKDFIYLFKHNNELFYGIFVIDINSINTHPKIIWFKIIIINNNFYFEKYDFNLNDTEHPFEYYAYKLSDDYIITNF